MFPKKMKLIDLLRINKLINKNCETFIFEKKKNLITLLIKDREAHTYHEEVWK